VSKECYDEKGCLDTKIISPGPFILRQSVPRQSALFEKNVEFQIKGAPWVDRIVLNQITDPAAQKAAFITGQIDNHRLFNPSETESMLKQRPGSQAVVMPFTVQGFSGRAQLKGPLADVRVRRAMVQGVDWRVVWEAGFEGMGMAMVNLPYDYLTGTLPPTLDEAGGYFKVDVAAAKQLLADAGYASGFELTIQTQIASGGWMDTLVAIQSFYKKNLGIDVKIQVLDGVSHSSNLYAGTWKDLWHSVCWIPACGFSDADNYMLQEVSWSPMNFNKVNDPKIDQFYLRQRSELDPAKRRDILWEYQRYTWNQFYTIPWGGFPVVEMMQPWEMNANSHTYASLGGTNGSAWTHMFDLSKLRK
jgi:peptide/nickel transport system substrate-binding protein